MLAKANRSNFDADKIKLKILGENVQRSSTVYCLFFLARVQQNRLTVPIEQPSNMLVKVELFDIELD
jgi:hypothetical protein